MKDRHDIHRWVEKIRHRLRLDRMPKVLRIILVCLLGGAIFVAGVIMLVTPGPGLLFIPVGLLLLACEFKCAERWAQSVIDTCDNLRAKWRAYKKRRATAKS
jgi:hypothetical protein